MRCFARILLLAAILVVAGCNLFRDSNVQVAKITSIVAPDTVHADSAFHAIVAAFLGPDSRYVLDHFKVSNSDAQLTVQAWSRFNSGDRGVIMVPSYQDLEIGASPTEPGPFRIIAIQPDGRDTLKTITVLP
jgi:hypothetical protein